MGAAAITTSTVLLPILGFGALGPALGSFAAAWQSSIGSVATGSLFAFLQSAGMGGAAAGLFAALGIAGAVGLVGPVFVRSHRREISQGINNAGKKVGEWFADVGNKIRVVFGAEKDHKGD